MSFNPELAPYKKVAKLLASIHAVPTEWYEDYHDQIVSRDDRIASLLAKELPRYAFSTVPFISGLENGHIHLGGGGHDAKAAKTILDMQIDSGVLQKMLSEEAFFPKTKAGQRIVTTHGDFKADNTLIDSKGELVPIDFECTCVAPAIVDLGFALCTHLNSGWGISYDTRFEFFQAYLENSKQPATEEDTRALMLDAEVNTLIGGVGLICNVWNAREFVREKSSPLFKMRVIFRRDSSTRICNHRGSYASRGSPPDERRKVCGNRWPYWS